jgi:hypothetical protein
MNRVFPGTERPGNDSASLFFKLLAAANIPDQLATRGSDAFFLASLIQPEAVAKYFVGGAPSNATAWAGAMKLSSNLAERVFLRPTPAQSEICRQAHPLTYLGSSARV